MGRFLSVDPDNAGADPAFPQTWNAYAYVNNNPLKYVDKNGEYLATAWTVANVAIGVASLASNIKQGNYVAAAVDAVGVALDVAATTTGLPGGAGTALKIARAADKVATATGAARTADKGREFVVDTNAVISHGKQIVESGVNAVKPDIVTADIRSATTAGRGRLQPPNAADSIPSVPNATNVNTRTNVRASLTPSKDKKSGNFADGVIGATAIERNSTLVTSDKKLIEAVRKAGGDVIKPDELLQ